MNGSLNQLVKSLLHKESIDQCSLPELSAYAAQYPWFGAAQLLLAKKMQSESPESYEAQYQKTLLFFDQPLWVDYLLNGGGTAIVETPAETAPLPATVPVPVTDESPVAAEKPIPDEIPVPADIPVTAATPDAAETAAVIPEPVPEIPAVAAGGTDLLFEPYHTVDYFASQGIRLRDEEKPVDKFGMQLKSFTEWLKTMKKFPVAETAGQQAVPADQHVEQLAGQSITGKDVLTEAMAEVWEKQGNTQKAIEIYRKLSLLEPAKSTYFAAKIDRLK